MNSFNNNSIIVIVILTIIVTTGQAQFWKSLHGPNNERELFILETRSSMTPGICYKEVIGKSSNPDLRIQTISFCCTGYGQATANAANALRCEPICTEDCANGICSAPDVCECYPGFARLGGRCEEL